MVREVTFNTVPALTGHKVYYEGHEVGHVVSVKGEEIICAIDSDIIAHRLRGGQAMLSLEVVDK